MVLFTLIEHIEYFGFGLYYYYYFVLPYIYCRSLFLSFECGLLKTAFRNIKILSRFKMNRISDIIFVVGYTMILPMNNHGKLSNEYDRELYANFCDISIIFSCFLERKRIFCLAVPGSLDSRHTANVSFMSFKHYISDHNKDFSSFGSRVPISCLSHHNYSRWSRWSWWYVVTKKYANFLSYSILLVCYEWLGTCALYVMVICKPSPCAMAL